MYIQNNKTTKNGKSYTYPLLCRKYRENGKIKTEVVANLSDFPKEAVLAIKSALQKQDDKDIMVSTKDISIKESIDYGFVMVLITIMNRLKITQSLQKILGEQANLITLMIIGKIITRGSKLSIYNWINRNKIIADKLKIDLKSLTVNSLYEALVNLSYVQSKIEKKWNLYHKNKIDEIYLYDITSSYFEGVQNELADYGYNRDGKKGKKQIVIGLITTKDGFPLSIEVFEGNENDHTTVIGQIQKIKNEFGSKSLVFVGDRGMRIRYNLEAMQESDKAGVNYITGLSIEEIKGLIKDDIIQLDLFSKDLVEIESDGQRYVLCTNPDLEKENSLSRSILKDKCESAICNIKLSYENRKKTNQNNLKRIAEGDKNKKLVVSFSEKQIDSYKYRVRKTLEKWHMQAFFNVTITNEEFNLQFNYEAYLKAKQLDGKYVFVSNLSKEQMTKENIRNEYKKLQNVEHAFRDMKTSRLDIRPIFHVNENTTRGHVFVTMFAYTIIREIETKIFPWLQKNNKSKKQQFSINDIEEELKMIKLNVLNFGTDYNEIKITELSENQKEILQVLDIDIKNLDM